MKTQKLVLSGIMLALASVLSIVKVWEMPLGGSVTLLSMLPICFLSIKYGVKWGLFSAFIYSLVQLGLDISKAMGWGLEFNQWIGMITFDYIIAFTVLGLAGIFGKKTVGASIGIALTCILRFCSHVFSGVIFFGVWNPEPEKYSNFVYSVLYNGAFMLFELIFTIIGAVLILNVPVIKKNMAEN